MGHHISADISRIPPTPHEQASAGWSEVGERSASLSLGGAKQHAMLSILLLHRGEAVSSERLIDELWGERPPAAATSACLRTG